MSAGSLPPKLYVEGKDDISVINALLLRHGIDTRRGKQHLFIQDLENVEAVLASMPDAIKVSTNSPVGFVIDIDIKITNRWNAVCGRLKEAGVTPPENCPTIGYFGQLRDYPHRFGVWLMPDCVTDDTKLEHLIQSLVPQNNPLWPHARASVTEAATIVDEANRMIDEDDKRWKRYREVDRIKAEVHTWLAWQRAPGAALGAAINDHILGHDSPQALAFLNWLKDLYGFTQVT